MSAPTACHKVANCLIRSRVHNLYRVCKYFCTPVYIPTSCLVNIVRLAADCRNLVCRQFQCIALITCQGNGFICHCIIIPRTVCYFECYGFAYAVFLCIGICVGRICCDCCFSTRCYIRISCFVGFVRLAADCRNLFSRQFQSIAIYTP